MNSTNNSNKNKWLKFSAAFFVSMVLLVLQGCGGGGGSAPAPVPVVNADPAGYYSSGSATVKDPNPTNVANNLAISDLQAMVNGNRFMMMSLSNALMYDATITSINGNDFTADVTIYANMAIADGVIPNPVINTTIKGTITEGSKITGTIAGSGAGSGDFSLTFSQSNSTVAELANVVNRWGGKINTVVQIIVFEFDVKTGGGVEVNASTSATAGLFRLCEMTGTVAPIPNSALYTLDVNLTAGTCSGGVTREGNYTGLVTTIIKTNVNDTLVVMFNNGAVAAMAEWGICPSGLSLCAQ